MDLVLTYDQHTVGDAQGVRLGTALTPNRCRYVGRIGDPRIFRMAMLALGSVVQSDNTYLEYDEWVERVLDPVVGVHPDGLSFEGFSIDGSALGWVQFGRSVFPEPEVESFGCTSIDFSKGLESFLRSLTSASSARIEIGAAEGIALADRVQKHVEKRIDLPDGWVRGFGEMHAALAACTIRLPLQKADLFNIVRACKRKTTQDQKGRALLFEFIPGQNVRVIAQPWNTLIPLRAKTPAEIVEPTSLKLYGRRRLELLESLVPHVQSATVHLSGDSRPHFWEMQLGGARFILALSSWTNRKFTQSFSESLRGPAALVDDETIQRGARLLADAALLPREDLAAELGITEEQATGVAMALCRQGLAVFEPGQAALRWRPVQHLPFAELGAGGGSSREENAARLMEDGRLELLEVVKSEGLLQARGRCEGSAGTYELTAVMADNGAFERASCTCKWMQRQSQDLKGGPCKHLLALRAVAVKKHFSEK